MLPAFNNPDLLETALTHRSALNEPDSSGTSSIISNERLEFLGDAVLELVVTQHLFHQYPNESEGKLTAYRSALVRTETLAEAACELKLGEMLYLSKGEEAGGGRSNVGLLADTFEAVIGALYLDQDILAVQGLVNSYLLPKLDEIKEQGLYKDAKSLLQEVVQAEGHPTPEYLLVDEQGPDHNKTFKISVKVDERVLGTGSGSSKQLAQQAAATQALQKLEKDGPLV